MRAKVSWLLIIAVTVNLVSFSFFPGKAKAHGLEEPDDHLSSFNLLLNNNHTLPVLLQISEETKTEENDNKQLAAGSAYNQIPSAPPKPKLTPRPVVPVAIDPAQLPVLYHLPISEPVVFLTIDDGVTKNQAASDYLKEQQLVASLFINDNEVKKDYAYFQSLVAQGSSVQNHTVHHPHMKKLPLDRQRQEICDNNTALQSGLGTKPTYFRPPYGELNDTTKQAAKECDMKAIIMWNVRVNNNQVEYRFSDHLQPGDIILLHFNKDLRKDLELVNGLVQSNGFRFGLLEDWLKY